MRAVGAGSGAKVYVPSFDGRLEVCYPFGRNHAREHTFDWLAHRLLRWPCDDREQSD